MWERMRLQLGRRSRDEGEDPPIWPGSSRKLRVLVETTDRVERAAINHELFAAGFESLSCGGPYSLHRGECPLLTGGGCPAAAGADAIFHRLNPANPANRAILMKLQERYPQTPIVVEIPEPDVERFATWLDGCTIVLAPADPQAFIAAVGLAVRSRVAATGRVGASERTED